TAWDAKSIELTPLMVHSCPPTDLPSAALATALQEHGSDDDQSLHGAVQVLADGGGEVEDVAYERQHDGADNGPPDVPRAALERGAADDHGGDGLELPEDAGRAGCRAEARDVEYDSDGHAQPLDHVGERAHALHLDRGVARD